MENVIARNRAFILNGYRIKKSFLPIIQNYGNFL